MATVTETADKTIADLLHRLGDVPPERVRMHPFPGTATEQDVPEIEAKENRLFELVDGVLVEKPMGLMESRLAVTLIFYLESYLDEHDIGIVGGADGMLKCLKSYRPGLQAAFTFGYMRSPPPREEPATKRFVQRNGRLETGG